MTKNFLLLLIFLVFGISLITFILILKYVNPYTVNNIVLIFFTLSFLFTLSSFLTFVFYIIKKIHYRGEVLISHISSSFRQAIFVGLYFLGLLFFYRIGIPIIISGIILFLLFLVFEFFIQNIFS